MVRYFIMIKSIKNGGIELGLLKIVGEENLSEADKKRKAYLESLPKNKWITLDENGKAVSDEEAKKMADNELKKFGL